MTHSPLLIAACCLACAPAYADRVGSPGPQLVAPVRAPIESPYEIELLDEYGHDLPTYQHRGRYYVLGGIGQRYLVRVTNHTDRRVEAVVSIDGLDVIDGEVASTGKRGYVVPARGELRIEGFRVSQSAVAAFRFSSVRDSYAGRKGKARNVGVIGLAIFEEASQPEVIVGTPPPRDYYDHYDLGYDRSYDGRAGGHRGRAGGEEQGRARAEAAPANDAPAAAPRSRGRGATKSADSAAAGGLDRRSTECCAERRRRPGLGTEYGEQRHSAVSFTRFERRQATRPDAYAELRYNDRDGLQALGVRIDAPYDGHELDLRETATPFPTTRFARPPRPGAARR